MTLASKDMELIKQEVAGIRDFYQSRWDSELPPLKEEVGRVAAPLSRIQELWRDGEKRALLAKFGGEDRPRALYGKYKGLDLLDLAYIRSVLNAQLRSLRASTLECWKTGRRT